MGACAVVLAVYVALAFVNSPRGFLGTDTGAKVATLRVMDHRHRPLDPDVGYWAERWDPTGRLHPLYQTARIGHRWVVVTTLPALLLGEQLYRVGGYRLSLALPMLGSLFAALAARSLARRLGGGEGWWAFWLVALGSPLALYAVDFWEHSIGVALMAWAVVLLLDVGRGSAGWRAAAGAGLLFGAAATLRQEAYVYAAVAVAAASLWLLIRRRRLVPVVAVGVAAAVAFAVPLAGNQALERATLGGTLRSQRVSYSTAGTLGTPTGTRVQEAALTAVGLFPDLDGRSYFVGAALLLLLLFTARAGPRPDRVGLAAVAAVGVGALYALRFSDGFGFVPGLIAATPFAAVGLAWAHRSAAARFLAGAAVLSLPLVWAFQFPGGASPQWAGRYILVSGFLLGVLGIASVGTVPRWAGVVFTAAALAVTGFGLGWLTVRSHDVARAAVALDRRPEPVLVSRIAHLAREVGASYGKKRWLTAVTDDDQRSAVTVLREASVREFGLVTLNPRTGPAVLDGYGRSGTSQVRFFSGVSLRVTTYRAQQ